MIRKNDIDYVMFEEVNDKIPLDNVIKKNFKCRLDTKEELEVEAMESGVLVVRIEDKENYTIESVFLNKKEALKLSDTIKQLAEDL